MDFLQQLVAGVLISLVTALVTVKLSIRQFKSQQLWERKVEAYEKVITALHNSKKFSSEHLDASYRSYELPKLRDEELRKGAQLAKEEIDKAADVGAFLLASEAVYRLELYQKDMGRVAESESWSEYLEADYAATNSCLKDLIDVAKSDVRS